VTAILALVSALIIGGSDFSGGVATRRDSTFRVTAWAQIWSGLTVVVLVWFVSAPSVTTVDVTAGALAGLSGTFSFVCFYAALSRGSMSVVAPTTAVIGAIVPAAVGFSRGEDLTTTTSIGLVGALAAIILITRNTGGGKRTDRTALILAVIAGLGFSIFFIALSDTHDAAGLWPLVVARVVSIPAAAVVARLAVGSVVPGERRSKYLAAYTGISEMLANVLLLAALRRGPLAVVSIFGSLYPVSTVVLAWLILRERIGRSQVVRVVLAAASLVLVAV